VASDALPRPAIDDCHIRGRGRAPRDRRQERAAGRSAVAGEGRDDAGEVDLVASPTTSPVRFGARRGGEARTALALAREARLMTIAFADERR